MDPGAVRHGRQSAAGIAMTAGDALLARWDKFWFTRVPLLRLAAFRVAVAWLCLYDAFLYDPSELVAGGDPAEPTWHPLLAFQLLGVGPPAAATTAVLVVAYRIAVLAVLVGFRTRTACLMLAVIAFWQGGVFYSLTKVRHDRVALCFATFALAAAPCGARLSIDAWRRHRSGRSAPIESPMAGWPIRLTQATIVIGYCGAGLSKLVTPGWINGYTLQGIILGHRGAYAEVVAADVSVCWLLSIVIVLIEAASPLCLWWPRSAWFFVPALTAFHFGTWATMDTGPYMTLWFLMIAFVPLDQAWGWLRGALRDRRLAGVATLTWSLAMLTVVVQVMARVVPLPWLLTAAGITVALLRWDAAAHLPRATG
jgi:hypothetical protein